LSLTPTAPSSAKGAASTGTGSGNGSGSVVPLLVEAALLGGAPPSAMRVATSASTVATRAATSARA
jgi:hypothetical protein